MQIAIITYSNDYLKTNVSFKSFPFEFVLSNQHGELEMLKVNLKREIRLPPPHWMFVPVVTVTCLPVSLPWFK